MIKEDLLGVTAIALRARCSAPGESLFNSREQCREHRYSIACQETESKFFETLELISKKMQVSSVDKMRMPHVCS